MRSYYLFVVIALLLIVSGCQEKENGGIQMPDPVLNIPDKVIEAQAEGGVYELAYTVQNPVDGAELVLAAEADWISGRESDDSKIILVVDPNDTDEDRNAGITVTYVYGEGLVLEDEIEVIQSCADASYDYNFKAYYISGGFFKDRGEGRNYCIYLSDTGMDKYLNFIGEGIYYRLDVYVPGNPEDWSEIQIPEGTYELIAGDSTCFWGSPDATVSQWEKFELITDGTLTVTGSGDSYIYEVVLTDINGDTHFVEYNGPVSLDLYSKEGVRLANYDIVLKENNLSDITYSADYGEAMKLGLKFYGAVEGGDDNADLHNMYFEIYAPTDDYKLLPGTYEVSTSMNKNTLYPGYIDELTMYVVGTFAMTYQDGVSVALAMATDGEITVEESNDIYTVSIDLRTAEGFSITGEYEGPLYIPNIPGHAFSTLEGDHTVDFSGDIYSFGKYFGDEYGTGGCYGVDLIGPFEQNPDETVMKEGVGEEVYLEFVTSRTEYDKEIPSGTYKAPEDIDNPKAGEFIAGYQSQAGQGVLSGTRYVGSWDNGYVDICAPAIDGELVVTNHGDGTYTFQFEFIDDRGNTWDGEWTGAVNVGNFDIDWGAVPAGPYESVEQVLKLFPML